MDRFLIMIKTVLVCRSGFFVPAQHVAALLAQAGAYAQ